MTQISISNAGIETPKVTLPEPVREEMHDRMLLRMEERSPEGRETHGQSRAKRWVMIGGAMLAIAGALAALGIFAGPAAIPMGIIIILLFIGIGAWPLVMAAAERRAEQKKFESRIEARIEKVEDRKDRAQKAS